MCNELIISTDAPFDLAKFNQKDVYFEQTVSDEDKVNVKYPYVYHMATFAPRGCSCDFRYWGSDLAGSFDFEFQELQDWMEELPDDDKILNTRFLFQVIKNLVNQGYSVDSYNAWFDEMAHKPDGYKIVKVNEIDKEKFTFFYGYYFDYQQ